MSIGNESGAARRFVANPPFWGSKMASVTTPAWQSKPARSYLIMVVGILAFTAVAAVLYMGVQSYVYRSSGGSAAVADLMDKVLRYGAVALIFGAVGGWYWWSQRSGHGKILIDVTRDALTVSKRPGDVYPFGDAQLGVWGISGGMTMGTTLHLHCGGRRFVLGGRDYRVAPGTRLEAPDAGYGLPLDVDAWVPASDFGEILAMSGRLGDRSGLAAGSRAPTGPVRCLLFPSPLAIQQMGPFAVRRKQQVLQSAHQPRLAIDVDADAVRVVDPNSNALVASAPVAQVGATPETYQYRRGGFGFGSPDQIVGAMLERGIASSLSTTPVLVLGFPGAPPLTIGCRDTIGGLDMRFSWPGNVRQRVNEPPDFSVSGGDFLLLVEKFGLTPYLQRHDQQV
ncbi:hypothetical protein [Mycobacterium sp. 1081908.1]|uniref:hypothetical protein n=1 Tax=Mycobacterium sp. 1081908.1 TaxID=1834066 RepID=UPI000801735B|nr:hypothetical protein [Mycobacterium sp. 1081908.1]OBK50373.1 hypothetical protein A5655_25600 [Mycobacterium sp. 1081908.1]